MRLHRLAPLALLLISPAPAFAGSRLPLTVRVYDMTSDRSDRTRALAVAAAALAPAEVDVQWLDPRNAPAGPVPPQDLVLRLARRTPSTARPGPVALGYALVDSTGRRGTVATIFLEQVEWLARVSGADVEELTGLAIAHEIGHLLTGTNAHARHGLMRARWTAGELRARRASDWELGPEERHQLRAGLAARLGTRPAAPDGVIAGVRRPTGGLLN